MIQQQAKQQTQSTIEHFSFWKIVAHLAPGLVTFIAFFLLKPIVVSCGYPPLMAFAVAVLLVDIPLLLGVLFYQGKKRNRRFSLEGVVLNLEDTKGWKFIGIFLLGIFIAAGLFALSAPIDLVLGQLFSGWLPEWLYFEKQAQYVAYNKNLIIQTVIFWTIVTGVLLPIVEELYFRGYLLPRMSPHKINAIVANALLFALYHFWQPYGVVTFFLQGLLFATFVIIYRNIKLSIIWHIIGNLQMRLMIAFMLLVK